MIATIPLPFPKKHLGQHFLHDKNLCKQIVNLLSETTPQTTTLEIGPGQGALTEWLLLNRRSTFYAIEIDPRMVASLHAHYPTLQDHLIKHDFLKFRLESITKGQIALIGNLPYNITSQILLRAIDYRAQVNEMVFIVQKEVAKRIVTPRGSKKYGLLSVWTQAFYDANYVLEIPPNAFYPPPKVTSAVIVLQRHTTQLDCHEKYFFHIVKTAFQQRRKVLSNALKPLGKSLTTIPEKMQRKRAEQLTINDFVQITQILTQT